MVFGTGDECARVICGAEREPPEDRDREWPLVKGERVRGRSGTVDVERVEKGDWTRGESGAVALLMVSARESLGSKDRALRGVSRRGGLSSTSTLGGTMVIGDSDTRGAMMSYSMSPIQHRGEAMQRLLSRYHGGDLGCCPWLFSFLLKELLTLDP